MSQIKSVWVLALFASIFAGIDAKAQAQTDTLHLDLEKAIRMARRTSVDAAAAINQWETAYWQYRTYRSGLLPEMTLKATVPSYSKRFSTYQNADGAYSFVPDDNLQIDGEISLSQRIWLTGGTISLTSSLNYMRQLSGNKGNNFMSVPVALTLNQPLFGVNDVKWDRKIEPVKLKEARAKWYSSTEEVAMQAITHYFNLLIAREALESSRQNYDNAVKLYRAAKAKRSMGQISENDLLQIELTMLTAQADVAADESTAKSRAFALGSFLGVENVEIDLSEPPVPHINDVDFTLAFELATENNAFVLNIRRRQLEADYEVAKARGARHEINLFAQVGYTGANDNFNDAYRNLKSNQVVEIGVAVPLLDWGKRKGAVRVAESQRELVKNTINKETIDFKQNLFILVERFNNQRQQVELAQKAVEIANKRYETNVETFLIGRISTLDLSDSQQNKDSMRQKQLNELFYYWYYFYQLRSLTLYDFMNKRTLLPIDS